MRLIKSLLPLVVLSILIGCGQKGPTQKEKAMQEWNQARAAVLQRLALDQYQGGDFTRSRKTVEDALRLDPQNPTLHLLSARLYIESNQLEIAVRELQLTQSLDPKNGEADYLLGIIYQRWQNPQRAYEHYKTASEKQSASLAYVMAQSEMLVNLNRSPEALTLLMGRLQYFEHSPAIRDAAGQLLMQQGRYAEAVDVLRQAAVLAPDDMVVREHLAFAFYHAQKYREASDSFVRLLKEESNSKRADLRVALSQCYIKLDRGQQARRMLEEATRISPEYTIGWIMLGRLSLEAGELSRAEAALKRAVYLDNTSYDAHLLMGYLRVRQERYADALASFQKANEQDKNDTVSLCMIGYAMEKMGRTVEAIRCYEKALKLHPQDDMATKFLASAMSHD